MLGRTRWASASGAAAAGRWRPDQVKEVRALGLVELERAAHGVEHVVGHAAGVAALETRVVLDADPREQRHLLAPQARHPARSAVGRETGMLRCQLRPARGEELADLVCVVHVSGTVRRCANGREATPSTPITRAFLEVGHGGLMAAAPPKTATDARSDMRAAIFNGPRDITVGDRPDPAITDPTDAIVRVVLGCVCGSDLWYYRGESPHALGPIGHEFIGVVTDVGSP